VRGVAAAVATLGATRVGRKNSVAEASVVRYPVDKRANASLRYKAETAKAEDINITEQPDNGDSKRIASAGHSQTLSNPVHPRLPNSVVPIVSVLTI
jgi:hypothetical protein